MKRLAALALMLIVGSPAMAKPMSYAEFQKLPQPPAPASLIYGADPLQHVEVWMPDGKGPFPVVLMLHGGCWQTKIAKADVMHLLAADLVKRGIAVWNVEYRGIDVRGGGYPGTFRDVAAAADMLAREGPGMGLDTRRVVAVGHSAGGHLALWLAARPNIPRDSMLWSPRPLPLAGVLSLGGLPDLAKTKDEAADACGVDTIDTLVGPVTATHHDVYEDTSIPYLLPIGPATEQVLVAGALDPIAPPSFAKDFAAQWRKEDRGTVTIIPDAGHFELITPTTNAWSREVAYIQAMLAQPRPR